MTNPTTPTSRIPSVRIHDISNTAAIRICFFFGIGVLFLAVVSSAVTLLVAALVLKVMGVHP